jgi:hypothetical protein
MFVKGNYCEKLRQNIKYDLNMWMAVIDQGSNAHIINGESVFVFSGKVKGLLNFFLFSLITIEREQQIT